MLLNNVGLSESYAGQYGQANPDLTGTIKGLTNGDEIDVTFSSSATSASQVGTYTISSRAGFGQRFNQLRHFLCEWRADRHSGDIEHHRE